KEIATKHAVPAAVWEILKYGVAVVPVLITAIALFLTYQKDSIQFQHQLALEQKFKIDGQAIPLLEKLSDDAHPFNEVHAAWALQSYGPPAIRLLVASLWPGTKAQWVDPFIVESLIAIVASESGDATDGAQNAGGRRNAADEVVERILIQNESFIADGPDAGDPPRVKAHFDAIVLLRERCAAACDVFRSALKRHASRI